MALVKVPIKQKTASCLVDGEDVRSVAERAAEKQGFL
jgi:hypothetical protein